LSTVSAQRGMHEAGRNVKQSRDAIDQAAAVVILEHALAIERNSGNFVGEEVS
jgi:putative Holliday junction resolvase